MVGSGGVGGRAGRKDRVRKIEVRYLPDSKPSRHNECWRTKCRRQSVVNIKTTNSLKDHPGRTRENCYLMCVYHATKLVVLYKDVDQVVLLARYVTRRQSGRYPVL